MLKLLRHVHGALNLETIEARAVFDGDDLKGLEAERKSRAKEIIEDFMITANGVTARTSRAKCFHLCGESSAQLNAAESRIGKRFEASLRALQSKALGFVCRARLLDFKRIG